jgi:hypothetical protein
VDGRCARHALPGRDPARSLEDWTKKGGKAYFGYKVHVGVDQGSGLVRSIDFTSAKINDSEVADGLICGDEAAVYADKAYEKKGRRARLKAAGIKDRIMRRRHKHIARLPHWQEKRNRLIVRRRAPVEAVFSAAKRLYGLTRTRYASLVCATPRAPWPCSRPTTCAAPRCWSARERRSASCVAYRVAIRLPRPPPAATRSSKATPTLFIQRNSSVSQENPLGRGDLAAPLEIKCHVGIQVTQSRGRG